MCVCIRHIEVGRGICVYAYDISKWDVFICVYAYDIWKWDVAYVCMHTTYRSGTWNMCVCIRHIEVGRGICVYAYDMS